MILISALSSVVMFRRLGVLYLGNPTLRSSYPFFTLRSIERSLVTRYLSDFLFLVFVSGGCSSVNCSNIESI